MKVDEEAKCPYCGDISWHRFHIDSDTLICNECDKEFAIKLERVVITKVLSDVLNTHICYGCDAKFHEGNVPSNGKCPECNVDLTELGHHDSPIYYK